MPIGGLIGLGLGMYWRARQLRFTSQMAAVAKTLGFFGHDVPRYAAAAERVAARLHYGEGRARALTSLLSTMADGVVAIGPDEHIEMINPAARRILDAGKSDMASLTLTRLARDMEVVALVAAARTANSTQRRLLRPLHLNITLQAVATPIAGTGRGRMLLLLHDVTEIEDQRTAQRDLIANLSHDLRTPVAAIKSLCDALSAGAAADERMRVDFIARIENESDRLTALTDDVIAAAKADALTDRIDWEVFDLSMMVMGLSSRFAQLAKRSGVELIESCSCPVSVEADKAKLELAVANVLLNAIKFTPPGNSVHVSVAVFAGDAAVSVADEGIGLDPEQTGRIFERFFKVDSSRGSSGTGLGLPIASRMVDLHGGKIKVDSKGLGAGSEFVITLPQRRDHAAAAGSGSDV